VYNSHFHDNGHGRRVGPNVSVRGVCACWFGLKLSVARELQDSHVDFKIAIAKLWSQSVVLPQLDFLPSTLKMNTSAS
jgi:hypothetical protein